MMASPKRTLVVVSDRYSKSYSLEKPVGKGDLLALSELKEVGERGHARYLGDKTADPFRQGELRVLGVEESHLELDDIKPKDIGDNRLLMSGLPVRLFVTSGGVGASAASKTVFEVNVDPLSIPGFTKASLKSEGKRPGYDSGSIVQSVSGAVYLETSGKRYMFDPHGGGRVSEWDREDVSGLGGTTKFRKDLKRGTTVEISPECADNKAIWIESHEPDFGANGYFRARLHSDIPKDPLDAVDIGFALQQPRAGYTPDLTLHFRYGHKERDDAMDYNTSRTLNQGVLERAAGEFDREQSNRKKTTRTYLVGDDGLIYENNWLDRENAQKRNLLNGPGNLLVSFDFDRKEKVIRVAGAVPAPYLTEIPDPKRPVDHGFDLRNNSSEHDNLLPDSIALLGVYMSRPGEWRFG